MLLVKQSLSDRHADATTALDPTTWGNQSHGEESWARSTALEEASDKKASPLGA